MPHGSVVRLVLLSGVSSSLRPAASAWRFSRPHGADLFERQPEGPAVVPPVGYSHECAVRTELDAGAAHGERLGRLPLQMVPPVLGGDTPARRQFPHGIGRGGGGAHLVRNGGGVRSRWCHPGHCQHRYRGGPCFPGTYQVDPSILVTGVSDADLRATVGRCGNSEFPGAGQGVVTRRVGPGEFASWSGRRRAGRRAPGPPGPGT